MNLEFSVPADLTFEQAIALTQDLLSTHPTEELLESAIAALIQSMNGARGFLVVFLTGDFALADRPTPAVIQGLKASPDTIADLMVKNIAMSTAMAMTHIRNQNPELAKGSQLTQTRSIALVQQLNLPEIHSKLEALQSTVRNKGGDYQAFLDRWGYDDEQRAAIGNAVQVALAS